MVAWLSSCPRRRGRRDCTSQSCDGCWGRSLQCTAALPIGNERVPIQLAQGRFPGLAISNAKILIYLSNKIHGSNLSNITWKLNKITIMAWNYQKADCSLRKKYLLCHFCNFWHLSFPMAVARQVFCRRCDALCRLLPDFHFYRWRHISPWLILWRHVRDVTASCAG